MTSASPTSEWSLLLCACSVAPAEQRTQRIRNLLQATIDWKLLFELADRHGAQPLLCTALAEFPDSVPLAAMNAIQQAQHQNLLKSMLLSRELIRIVESLAGEGLTVMPYKGPTLAEAVYGDIALRKSGDIDLLIRAAEFSRVKQVVAQLGYRPNVNFTPAEERAYLRSGYECAFDGPGGPNLLEVQWAIEPRFYSIDIEMNALFERGITVPVAGHPMKTLSYEDLILVLSVHAAKHVWGRLIWLSDIARLIVRHDLNWMWIGSQAKKLGIVRIVRITLTLAQQLLDAPLPAAAEGSFAEDPESFRLAEQLKTELVTRPEQSTESTSYFRLMLQLRERRADQIRILRRFVFTPGPGEWNTVRLPELLFPLYRCVRLWRLATRAAHA